MIENPANKVSANIILVILSYGIGVGIALAKKYPAPYSLWTWPNTVRGPISVAVAYFIIQLGVSCVALSEPGNATFELVAQRNYERLMKVPEFRERVRGISSKDEARQVGEELFRKGLVKLDGESLQSYVSLVKKTLVSVNAATCAALFRGTATAPQMKAAFSALDSASMNALVDISFKAAVAELKMAPVPQLSKRDIAQAFENLFKLLTPDQADQIDLVLTSKRSTTDIEACSAGRSFYDAVVALDEPYRYVLMRVWMQR